MARPRSQTPQQTPTQRQPSAADVAAAAAVAASPAVAGAAAALAGAVALTIPPAAVAGIVAGIVDSVAAVNRSRVSDFVPRLTQAVRQQHPDVTPRVMKDALKQEAEFEREFQRRQRDRLEADLTEALKIADPKARADRVSAILDREKRFTGMREQAAYERTYAAVERQTVKEMSPRGAYWRLSRNVKEHTPLCLALGERVWPWSVLDKVHPQLHPGCACSLYTIPEAVDAGWIDPDQVPDPGEALARARKLTGDFKDIREAIEFDAREYPTPRELRETGKWDPLDHPKDRLGRWAHVFSMPKPSYTDTIGPGIRYKANLPVEATNSLGEVHVGQKFFDLSPEQRRYVLAHEIGHDYDDRLLLSPETAWVWNEESWKDANGVPLNGPGATPGERIADAVAALVMDDEESIRRWPAIARIGRLLSLREAPDFDPAKHPRGRTGKWIEVLRHAAALTPEEFADHPRTWWHGTRFGHLHDSVETSGQGFHVGTYEAAREALAAQTGFDHGPRAEPRRLALGVFEKYVAKPERHGDGYVIDYQTAPGEKWSRDYGKLSLRFEGEWMIAESSPGSATADRDPFPAWLLLASSKSWLGAKLNGEVIAQPGPRAYVSSGKLAGNPEGKPESGTAMIPVWITGEMSNAPSSPHEDFAANGRMRSALKRGVAKRGYYYTNVSEDEGSISAVLPSRAHVHTHEDLVREALAEGVPVADEVLARYSHLTRDRPVAEAAFDPVEHPRGRTGKWVRGLGHVALPVHETVEPQAWRPPPPPVGKTGESRGGRGYSSDAAYGTNTALHEAAFDPVRHPRNRLGEWIDKGGVKVRPPHLDVPQHSIRESVELPKSGKLRKVGDEVLDAIDKLLVLPHLRSVPVVSHSGKNQRGSFVRKNIDGEVHPTQIRVSVNETPEDEADIRSAHLTLAHEIGHYLDFEAFGGSTEGNNFGTMHASFRAADPALQDEVIGRSDGARRDMLIEWKGTPSPLSPFHEFVHATAAYEQIVTDVPWPLLESAKYLVSDKELFARAFAQWVAVRSGNQAMMDGIRRWQTMPESYTDYVENWKGEKRPVTRKTAPMMRATQWQDDDFEPVARALDYAFTRMGWLRQEHTS